jgi:predicted ribosomally synthesized peptide with SipW-like signal peptide
VTATTGGAAVTLNSNNSVNNAGSIGFTDINNATGVLIQGGHTGNFTNTGSITLTESYTAPADPNNDGLNTGDFASGGNRIGVLVTGTSPFTGNFIDTGTITVQGNSAQSLTSTAGVLIDAPITGTFLMETETGPVTSSTAAVAAGSISVTGNNTVGLLVTPNGSIGGSVHLTGITATGVNARAVVINGNVGGFLDISGAVTATGYRTTSRSTNPIVSELYTAGEMEQGGPAVTIGGSVAGGVIISAPPIQLTTPSTTTYVDADGNGITDSLQGTGSITSYGSSPALQIGAGSGKSITLGAYETGTPTDVAGNSIKGYGLIIQGSVSANGLFDQLSSPNLPGPVSATAIQIGGMIQGVTGAGKSGAVNIQGGLYNGGGVVANAYQADATAIHIGLNATVPTIKNDGTIEALSTQVNSATTSTVVTPITGPSVTVLAPAAVTVTAIQIDKGANVTTINNTSGIAAELTGTGGPTGNAVYAIRDQSGTLANIMNSGSINAELVQTLDSALIQGTTTAIDISAGTGAQTIRQTVSPNANAAAYVSTSTYVIGATVSYLGNVYIATAAAGAAYDPVDYPTYWREIGSVSPTISGDILMGSGPDTLDIEGGTVLTSGGGTGLIAMGASTNTITVNSTSNSSTTVQGYITEQTGGAFNFNVGTGATNSGQYSLLSDTNPTAVRANSINVGATGILVIAVDPVHNTNTTFITGGASTFANGAQIGLTMQSLQVPLTETYTVVKTTAGGTINAGTFGSGSLSDSPYLFTASPAFVVSTPGGGSAVDLTVTRKTAAQLGFNNAEASALSAVLGSLPNDANIQAAVLSQTTQAGLKSVYDQLLPNQGQGIFDALDSAVQKVASMTATTPDAGTRVAGTSLWLQEVNERVERSGTETLGSSAQLFGLVGGYEHMGAGGGAIGVTLAYFNAQEEVANAAPHENVVASMIEAGAYYRRTMGHLTLSARGAGGYSWFSSDRRFLEADAANTALASWGGYFVDAHASAAYEMKFGRFYARPELSVDYLHLDENAENEQGGGTGFDLNVAARSSTRLSGQAIMVLGRQYGGDTWLRPEIRFGYREIISGEVGDTVASFAGGTPFTLSPDNDKGGWAVIGFSIKGGTQYSYIALEGDAEFRSGEQEYDLRIAGRSMF